MQGTVLEIRRQHSDWVIRLLYFGEPSDYTAFIQSGINPYQNLVQENAEIYASRIITHSEKGDDLKTSFASRDAAIQYAKSIIERPSMCGWPDKIRPDMPILVIEGEIRRQIHP